LRNINSFAHWQFVKLVFCKVYGVSREYNRRNNDRIFEYIANIASTYNINTLILTL